MSVFPKLGFTFSLTVIALTEVAKSLYCLMGTMCSCSNQPLYLGCITLLQLLMLLQIVKLSMTMKD